MGPVEGGFVTVGVGTINGQARLENAYEYEVDDMYEGQVAFLAVTNDYFSCLGGVPPSIWRVLRELVHVWQCWY